MESPDDWFPRIESARDNLGTVWVPSPDASLNSILTKKILHPGDRIEVIITASDPLGGKLMYGIQTIGGSKPDLCTYWQESNEFSIDIQESHISRHISFQFVIKSDREYHANTGFDDHLLLAYQVLPAK